MWLWHLTGLILPNGDINWNCPCLGGMASGPCGMQFRDAFSCFHYSKAEPKGSDCFESFRKMQDCMQKYPELYPAKDEEDPNTNQNQSDELDEVTEVKDTQQEDKSAATSSWQENGWHRVNFVSCEKSVFGFHYCGSKRYVLILCECLLLSLGDSANVMPVLEACMCIYLYPVRMGCFGLFCSLQVELVIICI